MASLCDHDWFLNLHHLRCRLTAIFGLVWHLGLLQFSLLVFVVGGQHLPDCLQVTALYLIALAGEQVLGLLLNEFIAVG